MAVRHKITKETKGTNRIIAAFTLLILASFSVFHSSQHLKQSRRSKFSAYQARFDQPMDPSKLRHVSPNHNLKKLQKPPPRIHQHTQPETLNLIENRHLQLHDYFSDSWLLNKDNFLRMNIKRIGIVEDACFEAIGKRSIYPHSKMFHDWTEFMVEHMSKWWKVLTTVETSDPTMFNHTIKILKDYWKPRLNQRSSDKISPLHPTIAMIAFAPYKSAQNGRGPILTAHSLAATIVSLYQVGFGRVIVAGYGPDDHVDVNKAFQLLSHHHQMNSTHRIGNTELAYVRMTNESWIRTQWVKINIPRGVVIGMQRALGGSSISTEETNAWLGTTHPKDYWKYVYLTEPDTILHTKPHLLELIKSGLEKGLSFFPHRIQPLPHEHDLPNQEQVNHFAGRFVPARVASFSNITTLSVSDSCCDGGPDWPGRSTELGSKQRPCGGSQWWACGLQARAEHSSVEEIMEQHKRLLPYPLMRLEYGTGVVFASTNQGRRCFPSRTRCSRNNTF